MRGAILLAAGLAFLAMLGPRSADAAEVSPSASGSCRFLLKGEIQSGDLAKLEVVQRAGQMGRNVDPATGDIDARLCLYSTGGNFIEGVKIAKFISENGWGTVVDENQSCLSACSIIFMAGRVKGPEEDGYNRRLHVRGTLGFHRPMLVLPGTGADTYTSSAVQAAYDAAIDSVVVFLSMGNQVGMFSNTRRVRMSLFEEMMKHTGNDFFFIDTVDKAGRWEVEVFGYERPQRYSDANIYNACSNFISWANDESNDDGYAAAMRQEYPQAKVERGGDYRGYQASSMLEAYKTWPGKNGLVEVYCEIHVYQATGGSKALRGCFNDGFTGLQYGQCAGKSEDSDVWIDPIAMFEPETRLKELGAGQAPAASPALQGEERPALKRLENADLYGEDLRRMKGLSEDRCLSSCMRDASCSGATYDRWNRLCVLKRQAYAATVSAKAISWVSPSLGISQPYLANVGFVKRRDRRFIDNNYYVSLPIPSYDGCASRCAQEERCIAVNYRPPGLCEFFSAAPEYMPSRGDIAAYKSGR